MQQVNEPHQVKASTETPGLWDIVKLFLGSSLATFIVVAYGSLFHGSKFSMAIVGIGLGNLWYLGRYEWLSRRRGWMDLRQRFAPVDARILLMSAGAGAALVCIVTGIFRVLTWAGVKLEDLPMPAFAFSQRSQLPAAFLVIAIVAPLAEELIFRGLLLDWLRSKMRTWGAVVLVSLLFSLVHGISIKSGLAGWMQSSYRVVVGIIAATLTVRFRSLRPSFIFHATINSLVVLAGALLSGGWAAH